jgi:hypothetical protein
MPLKKLSMFTFILLGLLCFGIQANQARAAISLVQATTTQTNYYGSPATTSVSFASNTTAGDLIVFVVGATNLSTGTISDTAGDSFTLATSTICTGAPCGYANSQSDVYYASNINGGADTVNFAWTSAPGNESQAIFEYAGIATSSPVDQINSAIGGPSLTSINTGNITTTQASELLFSSVTTDNGTSSPTVSGGWTEETNGFLDINYLSVITADQTVSSIGTYSNTFGGFPSTALMADIVAFKAASSASSPPPTEYWLNGIIKLIGTFIFH